MKLTGSLVVTVIIVATFWWLAILQPAQSNTLNSVVLDTSNRLYTKAITSERIAPNDKTRYNAPRELLPSIATQLRSNSIAIIGITKRIALSDIDMLWLEFSENSVVQNTYGTNTDQALVLYKNFDPSFKHADVTIGYLSKNNNKKFATTTIPSNRYHPLLSQGMHNKSSISNAWSLIDYSNKLNSVLEVHYLKSGSFLADTTTDKSHVEVLVSYQ